jgi:hypothetical protein
MEDEGTTTGVDPDESIPDLTPPFDLAKAKNLLYGKLAIIMGELSAIPRDKLRHVEVQTSSGGTYSYDYITEATLMEELRPRLAREGIAVFYSDEVIRHPTKDDNLTVVRVTLTFADAASDSTVELTADGYGTDRGDKGANKAKTTALRYLLWKTFLFASDLDPETESVERQARSAAREPSKSARVNKPATQGQKQGLRTLAGEMDDRGVELNGRKVYDAIHLRTPIEDMTYDQAARTMRLLNDANKTGELALTVGAGQTDPLDAILGPVTEGGDFPPEEVEPELPGSQYGEE